MTHIYPGELKHEGVHAHRLASNPREAIFAELWECQQFQSHTLQWLLAVSPDQSHQERDVTQEEATCAATLMQWLGSPVGFCFLTEALDKCGYAIVLKINSPCG